MTRTQRWSALAAIITLALTATGCSSGKPADALTVPSASVVTNPAEPSSTASSSDAPSETPTPIAAPKPLTKAQAIAALPPASAFGKPWKVSKPSSSSSSSSSKDKITPKACQTVYAQLDSKSLGTPVAKADRDYKGSIFGPFVSVGIRSYADVPADGVFVPLANALGACPTFTSVSPKGLKTVFHASALKFPNVGDQTLAFQLKATSRGLTITMQFAVTVVGSTEVIVTNAGIGKIYLPAMTLTAMNKTLARLPH